jgi:hypothetical protein
MGFLSKLFGGDAVAAPGKTADEPSPSAATRPNAVAVSSLAASEVALARAAAAAPPVDATPVGLPAEQTAPPAAPAIMADAPAPASPVPAVSTGAAPDTAAESPRAGRPTLQNTERQPASSSTHEPPVPNVPRRAPDSPRRAAQLESSIITSAPALGIEASRAPAAPRPGAVTRSAKAVSPDAAKAGGTDPNGAHRAPMSSVSGETGLLGARGRKDRSKSPGFYSNMAPAYGAQVVSANPNQSALRRTTVGLAPPPDLGAVEAAPAPTPVAEPPEPVASAAAEAIGDAATSATAVERMLDIGATETETPDSAPVFAAPEDELEKEATAPGVGHMPSRHDPVIKNEFPDRDLDLLVQFVMDVGLGLASEAWLAPVRGAVSRLKAAAVKFQRSGLDKALAQLELELEAPNALAEERKSRIVQQLVLVDLALPRPIDVSGQRVIRERLIVQHLLSDLSVAHPLIAQRLRDEGSLSLERLARIAPAELAEKASITAEQAEHALSSIRDYLLERARRGPEAALLGKAHALEQRLVELEASAQHFERVADGDDVPAKREARKKRQSDIGRLSLFLAEWGEAGILGEFERCSVQGKIARLRRWLTDLPAS